MRSRGVDSAYSWLVAAACSMVFSTLVIPMRLGSQLFVSLIDSFGTTRDAASLPFELAYFARSISGPLAGYFGQAIGLRNITLLGSFIGTIGLVGCFFANNIVVIDIFLGLIFGFGFGLATAVAPEIINQHFQQHRTKAMGLVFGVSGLAAALTPPLLEYILNKYGGSGSFLIISGIVFNAIPMAMLITEPNKEKDSTQVEDGSMHEKLADDKMVEGEDGVKSYGTLDKSKEKNLFDKSSIYSIQSFGFMNLFSKDSYKHIFDSPIQNSILDHNSSYKRIDCDEPKLTSSSSSAHQVPEFQMVELGVNNLSNHLNSNERAVSNNFKPDDNINSIHRLKEKASKLESISILWSPKFLFLTIIQSSHFYIMYMFWTITVDIVRDKGVSRDLEVYFVMALSFFDTIGRFFLASLIDCTTVTAPDFSSVCFVIIGLSCLLLVFVSGFEATMAAICLLGLIVGGNTTSLPGIVTLLIEKNKRSLAMASRLIMYAPMSFTMSPLIGYFREVRSSYNGLLYIMVCMSFACSAALQILYKVHRCNS